MAGERPELTPAQEILVRALTAAVLEDIVEEKATAPDAAVDSEPEHAEAACR